jgi:glutathione synthase/RimK-type ligase-like ATP-grasp enzyme
MGTVRYLNHPSNVSIARDKRETLTLLSHNGVPTVEWTLDVDVALQWFSHGDVVVQRNTATGQGGAGIVVCDPTLPGNVAPTAAGVLFTKYFKRKQEFRIHVWGNDVLDIQLKKKRRGEEADPRIRSHNNGWVFCREGVVCPEQVSTAAVEAVRALGLDFGAVDIGWNERKQTAAVFEVNTAPGVEGTTLDRYVSKIKEAVL